MSYFQAQNERADNSSLRTENERIHCENLAIVEALKSVICPACGGPPFREEDRQHGLQKLMMENARLKEEVHFNSHFKILHFDPLIIAWFHFAPY